MFTLTQIKDTHSKVKNGSDFPQYIRDLITLGVLKYSVHVVDGHTEYIGKENNVTSDGEYAVLEIASKVDIEKFKDYLKVHQQGKTDYFTFCRHSAETGISSWTVDTISKTCTYYDKVSNAVVTERIPL